MGKTRVFKGGLDCLQKLYRSDGIRGLYKGLGVSVVGFALYRGLYFSLYESGKTLLFDNYESLPANQKLLFAALTTTSAGMITYPLDTVKARLMMMSGREPSDVVYKTTMDCFQRILKEEGVRGFYKGLSCCLASGLYGAGMLVMYD